MEQKHIRIVVLRAYKRIEDDSYVRGCIGNESQRDIACDPHYPSILAAFHDIVGDKEIKPDQIGTFDPNIYQDVKGGGHRTVCDNVANGRFRCMFDRQENKRGRVPTEQEEADFKASKINLRLATYELEFNVIMVGMDEQELAKFLGVNNW